MHWASSNSPAAGVGGLLAAAGTGWRRAWPPRRRSVAARLWRSRLAVGLGLGLALLGSAVRAGETPARIVKVLPHRLDLRGRHAISPSLYERDAYQAYLRRNPKECSGLRFDVQWKAKLDKPAELKLRLEVLTSQGSGSKPLVLEQAVTARSRRSKWSALTLAGEEFRRVGEPVAWRASLWDQDRLLAEQKSFLW